jgi:hypothetical protein
MDSEERDQRNKEGFNERGEKYEKPYKNGIRQDLPEDERRDEDLHRDFSNAQRGDDSEPVKGSGKGRLQRGDSDAEPYPRKETDSHKNNSPHKTKRKL